MCFEFWSHFHNVRIIILNIHADVLLDYAFHTPMVAAVVINVQHYKLNEWSVIENFLHF